MYGWAAFLMSPVAGIGFGEDLSQLPYFIMFLGNVFAAGSYFFIKKKKPFLNLIAFTLLMSTIFSTYYSDAFHTAQNKLLYGHYFWLASIALFGLLYLSEFRTSKIKPKDQEPSPEEEKLEDKPEEI